MSLNQMVIRPARVAKPVPVPASAPAASVRRPSAQAATPPPGTPKVKLSRDKLATFLSSLSTMVRAGVPLYRALDHMAQHAETVDAGLLASSLAEQIGNGRQFSRAAATHPNVFTPLQLGLLRVAENSGNLDDVLERMSNDEQKALRTQRRLTSALVYPAGLLVLCGFGLMLAPPLLLEPQFQLIRDLHVEIPWFTRALMGFSSFMRTPWPWVLLCMAAALVQMCLRPLLAKASVQSKLTERLLHVPKLGVLLRHVLCARFAQSVGMQMSSGVGALQSMHLAGEASGNPYVQEQAERACQAMLRGAPVWRSLQECALFPPLFLAVVQCGEETGDLAKLFGWLSDLHESEVDGALDTVMALVEPFLLAGMGLTVGGLVVATMLPMAKALDSI